jgi:3'(2'), 5'-bisphosphate nucleotidase
MKHASASDAKWWRVSHRLDMPLDPHNLEFWPQVQSRYSKAEAPDSSDPPAGRRSAPAVSAELLFAVKAARAAGAAAMRFYGSATAAAKSEGSPVTEADHASNAVIVGMIKEAYPEDAVLSEESVDDGERLAARRVWIVDPLDGTKEFLAENGEFSIMIGLVVGGEPVVGVVYAPATDTLYGASSGGGAWVERDGARRVLRCRTAITDNLRLVGSRSHPDELLMRMQKALGITDVRPSGSVGIKCGLIAEAQRDLYIHPVPYLKEWDTCAPEVILREAGGSATDCRGAPLRYNKPDPAQPHGILASAPGLSAEARHQLLDLYASARVDLTAAREAEP